MPTAAEVRHEFELNRRGSPHRKPFAPKWSEVWVDAGPGIQIAVTEDEGGKLRISAKRAEDKEWPFLREPLADTIVASGGYSVGSLVGDIIRGPAVDHEFNAHPDHFDWCVTCNPPPKPE